MAACIIFFYGVTYAGNYAEASLEEIFIKTKPETASILGANYFPIRYVLITVIFNYTARLLPWQAQLTTYRDGYNGCKQR